MTITFVQWHCARSVLHIYETHTYQSTLNFYRRETHLLQRGTDKNIYFIYLFKYKEIMAFAIIGEKDKVN